MGSAIGLDRLTPLGAVAIGGLIVGNFMTLVFIPLVFVWVVIYTTKISSLKRFNDDVKEVKSGYECGIMLENFNDIKEGDVIETFKEVEEQVTL